MDSRLLEEWKLHTNDKTAVPAGDELIEFCDQRELILSSTAEVCNQDPRPQFYRPNFKSSPTSSNKRYSKSSFALHNVDVFNCRLCQAGDHPLYHCAMFKAQDPVARRKTLQSLQCCFNCLGSSHTVHQCTSRHSCKECGNRHHTLLHRSDAVKTSNITPQQSLPTQPTITTASVTLQTALTVAIPDKTALIWSCQVLLDTNGCSRLARAMIDPGSTLSFITVNLVNSLKAKKIPFPTSITGLSQTHAATNHFRVDVTLMAPHDPNEKPLQISPSVVTSIMGITPTNDLSTHQDLDFTKNLTLADPSFGSPGQIDLLLGQDTLYHIMRQAFLNSPNSELYGVKTMFGWVVGGCCSSPSQAVTTHVCCQAKMDFCTNDLLKAFLNQKNHPQKQNSCLQRRTQLLSSSRTQFPGSSMDDILYDFLGGMQHHHLATHAHRLFVGMNRINGLLLNEASGRKFYRH